MIAILKQSASDEAVGHIVSWIEKKGLKTDVSRGENETAATASRSAAISSKSSPAPAPSRARTSSASHAA